MKHLRQQFDYGNETNAIASIVDVRDRIRKNPMFEKYGKN